MTLSGINKRIFQKGIAILFFSSFLLFSCNGVHNEPPEEVIRTSGAGPSLGAGEASATGLVGNTETVSEEADPASTDMQRRNIILDSSGNPITLD
jgi:hypothetical protein